MKSTKFKIIGTILVLGILVVLYVLSNTGGSDAGGSQDSEVQTQ